MSGSATTTSSPSPPPGTEGSSPGRNNTGMATVGRVPLETGVQLVAGGVGQHRVEQDDLGTRAIMVALGTARSEVEVPQYVFRRHRSKGLRCSSSPWTPPPRSPGGPSARRRGPWPRLPPHTHAPPR